MSIQPLALSLRSSAWVLDYKKLIVSAEPIDILRNLFTRAPVSKFNAEVQLAVAEVWSGLVSVSLSFV